LVCLTQDELRNIQETGTYVLDTGNNNQNSEENSRNISENKKDKEKEITNFEIKEKKIKEEEKESNIESSTTELTLDENNNMSIFIDKEVDLKGVGKKARKKRQRYKKKKKKMLEKYGLSNVEIEDKMTEVINDINLEMEKEQFEENVKNFDLDDIIERPRIASVPKVNLNLYSHEKNKRQKSEENSEESEEIKYDDDENNDIIPFDINLLEYSKSIQGYIKERNRILHDETYRRFAITRNEALSKAKTDDEKIEVYKKFNNEYNTRGKEIDPSIEVKICDIGNACWFDYHFSTIIQTRQYRSPEVLIGVNYNETSDIWSLACIVFELVTGDFLFQPEKGDTFTKNDDHVAKFIYTLGKMPKNFAKRGEYYNKFFTKEGKLRRIKNRKFIGLKDILVKKYHFKEFEAQALTDFLLPMLEYYPERRASARELLRHPWLTMPPNYDYRMSDTEIFKMNMRENLLGNYYDIDERKKDKENDDRDVYSSDSELNEADCEDNDKKAKIQDDEDDDTQLGDNNPDKINIPNYNNSFCMYGQFVDLTSLDQPNPQFDKIIDKDLL
jgi:serine/threonine-protein kinase SRPK3